MTAKRITTWRPGWRLATIGVAIGVVVAGAAVFAPMPAEAVHDALYGNFEIDGEPTDLTPPSGAASNPPDDWDSVFEIPDTNSGADIVYQSPRKRAEAGAQEVFIYDDGSYSTVDYGFSGQSNKDIQDVGQWLYDDARVTPDKDNLTHAFAKAYHVQVGATGPAHLVIDFGADRFAINGDAAMGFWFFQDDVGRGPANRRGVGAFEGEHVDGDILVQVDFVQGGTRANKIQIFAWRGDGLGTHGKLDQLAYQEGTGNAVCTANNAACAQTNSVAWPSPWAYTPKAGPSGIFGVQSFFEGGIDVTALIGHEVCFSSFMAETRTSHSETAELKDFALGDFQLCSVDLVRKSCVANTMSPLYFAATNTFQTEHVIEIHNDGFGPIYDVAIQDNAVTTTDATSTTGSSCRIMSVSGGVNPVVPPATGTQLPVASATTGWIPVAGALSNIAGQDTINVTVRCVSAANPFANSATVRASAITGLDASITDFYAEVDTQVQGGPPSDVRPQCEKNPSALLEVKKTCPTPVVFQAVGGIYRPKVCVDISIENKGEQYIDMVSFIDSHNDGNSASLLGEIQTSLEPGYRKSFTECYTPSKPDANNTDPDTALFGDTVTATATARRAATTPIIVSATASCPLCPTGLDGAPPAQP